MKIGSSDNPAQMAALQGQRQAAERGAPNGAAAGPARATDDGASTQVQLSATASLLQGSQASEGSFDAEKVQRIAQAIRDGQFKINPEKIADKLISNARELLGGER